MRLLRHRRIFQILCYIPSLLGLIPLTWRYKTMQLEFIERSRHSILTPIHKLYIQYLIYTLVPLQGILCFYLDSSRYNLTFTDTIIYGFVFVGLLGTIVIQASAVRKASSHCLYVNGIIQISKSIKEMENEFLESKNSLIKKLDFAFAAVLAPNVSIYPFVFVFGLHWFTPCKPSLAGFPLIPECSNLDTFTGSWMWNAAVKFAVSLANHWSWTAGVFSVAYCSAGILVLCVLSFGDFVQIFRQMSSSESDDKIYETGLFYRKLQVMGCLCNEVQQSDLMLVILFAGTLQLTIGTTAAFWVSWTSENAVGLALYGVCMYDMVLLLLICVGAMAEIFEEYEQALHGLKRRGMRHTHSGCRLRKWKERFYLSCTPIKFKYGRFNFVDRQTPLNCLMFAVTQSVSLILLGKTN